MVDRNRADRMLSTPDVAECRELVVLQSSGLFDGAWFTVRNQDFTAANHDALLHFHRFGWREGRWPNPYFDPAYYISRYGARCGADTNPLLHYIERGEAEGCRPVPYFDPSWYREQYDVAEGDLCLRHFLAARCTGKVSAIPEFDGAYYLQHNPDVADAGMDPLEHYLLQGFREGRRAGPASLGRKRNPSRKANRRFGARSKRRATVGFATRSSTPRQVLLRARHWPNMASRRRCSSMRCLACCGRKACFPAPGPGSQWPSEPCSPRPLCGIASRS